MKGNLIDQLGAELNKTARVELNSEDVFSGGKISPKRKDIRDYVSNVIDEKTIGYELYFENVQDMTGKIEKGHIWIIGGFSGTGKSYFTLNLVEGILGAMTPPKVGIFSTELSQKDYIKRLLFLRAGVYELAFIKNPKYYQEKIQDNLTAIENDPRFEEDYLLIWGDIATIEEIEDRLAALKKIDKVPEVIVIDWVQQLSVDGVYAEKDAMPVVAKRIKKLTIDFGCAVIVVSQVNNYANNKDYKMDSSQTAPFSFGKELNQMADVAIMLQRQRVSGKQSKHLACRVTKARHGSTGIASFEVESGFRIKEISTQDGISIDEGMGVST